MNEISARFYRLLLCLYPADFRESYGDRMEEAFLASLEIQRAGRGWMGVAWSWSRASWDTVAHSLDLRFRRPGRRANRRPASSRPGSGKDPAHQPGRPAVSTRVAAVLTDLLQDLRYTLRSIMYKPTFSFLVVLIAAVGISLTTLAFTTVNASFLRPLPHVRAPEELVFISREFPSRPSRRFTLSHEDYLYLREESKTLTGIVGLRPDPELMFRMEAELDRRVMGAEVTANYFQVLGIPMALGRGILPEDGESGNHVAVLGHATWIREFGGDSDALGRIIRVDGRRHEIVGVAPPGVGPFTGEPVEFAVWIPLQSRYKDAQGWNVLNLAGRRRTEVGLPQVQAEFDAFSARLAAMHPDHWTEPAGAIGLRIMTDRQARLDMVGGPRGVASILIYMVFICLIMAIACSNVASLLLNRALRRRPEIAVRLALGAGRGRLVRQLLTESVVLFLIAGGLSLLLLHWGTQLLAAGWGAFLPGVADITVDSRVTGFAIGVTTLCGILFGLVPALQATRPELAPTLRGTGEGRRFKRFGVRNLFVLAQVAASTVLVAVSALLVRDVQRAESVDVGFDSRGIAVASLDLSHGDYDEEEGRIWLETLSQRLEGLPGVADVAMSLWAPLSGNRWTTSVWPEGFDPGLGEGLLAAFNAVSPGYFEMVGMPILNGREFTDSDTEDATPVVVVNQAFAQRHWPDQDPMGKRVILRGEELEAEVVGVVRDAMYSIRDFREGASEPHVWVPRAQKYQSRVLVHVRTLEPGARILEALRAEIRLLDEDLPILVLSTMERITRQALFEERAASALFSVFSALALFLAALGIYGLIAHAVAERTREMGVRLAVGAGPMRLVGMVLAESIQVSVLGIVVGLGLAALVGIGIRVLLVGVSILDPLSYSGSVLVLALAAATAALVPALRAARTDPVLSLKSE